MRKFKIDPLTILYFLVNALVWYFFGVLGLEAYEKYKMQPVSTEISHVRGNCLPSPGLVIPPITFCEDEPYHLSRILKQNNCSLIDSIGRFFFNNVMKCITDNPTMDLDHFIESLNWNVTEFFQRAYLAERRKRLVIDINDLWRNAYHYHFGPCFTLYLNNLENFHFNGEEVLRVHINEHIPWNNTLVLLHDIYSFTEDPVFLTKYSTNINIPTSHFLSISKHIIEMEPRKIYPCAKYSQKACLDILFKDENAEKHGCQVSLMRNLQWNSKPDLSVCNKTVTLSTLKSINNIIKTECPNIPACRMNKFSLKEEKKFRNFTEFVFIYGDPVVEIYNTTISYNFQSLIAEFGGTMGLTLGASCASVVGLFFKLLRKIFYTFGLKKLHFEV